MSLFNKWIIFASLACVLSPVFAIDLHGIPKNQVAVWVADTDDGNNSELAAYRADASISPASTMKVLTSFSALATLGANYRWSSKLASAAPVVDGVLQGDLYWIGSGDPSFSQNDLLSLLEELQLHGIHEIQGRLILDSSIWTSICKADNFESDKEQLFMVAPSPHLISIKGAWLKFYFDEQNQPQVAFEPSLQGVKLQAKLSTSANIIGDCNDVSAWVKISEGKESVSVSGKLPRSCNNQRYFVSVNGFAVSAARDFVEQWHNIGGLGLSSIAQGTAPSDASVLAEHKSEPLSEVIKGINKMSNNTMARALYLTLGAYQSHGLDTAINAQIAERRSIAEAGISDEVLELENGSGLSRRARVSARLLGEILRYSAQQDYANALIDSLPISGVDGTLKHRFIEQTGRLHMKTGTLSNVRALAGYWLAPNGHKLVIVVIINSAQPRKYLMAMQKIVYDQIDAYQAAEFSHLISNN